MCKHMAEENTAQVQGQAGRRPDTTQKEQRSEQSLSVVLN